MFLLLQEAAGKCADKTGFIPTVTCSVTESVNQITQSVFGRLPFLLSGVIVLLIFWFLSKGIKTLFMAATGRTRMDKRLRILFSRMVVIFVIIIGVFTALTVVIPSFTFGDLIAGLGFTSFVVGFATKDILNNFLSGVLILWQQPFRIGDHIFVGKDQGKVEYIGVRATSLRKDDGELVLIPNGDMYSSALTIRGAGSQRRMSLKFSIGYEADIAVAKKHIREALHGIGKIVQEPEERIVVTDLTSDGVDIAVYYWINTNENRPMDVVDAAATAIKEALEKAGIELYPPGSVIVKQAKPDPDDELAEEDTPKRKRSEF